MPDAKHFERIRPIVMIGPGKMPQLIDERLLGDMKPDPPLRHVRLQRLDAQQLVRAVDESRTGRAIPRSAARCTSTWAKNS